jgi:hypothetical protein
VARSTAAPTWPRRITSSNTDGDATRVNLLTNPDFASDTAWTKGTGWTWDAGGWYKHAAGSNSLLTQAITSLAASDVARIAYTVRDYVAGSFHARLQTSGSQEPNPARTASGRYVESITAAATSVSFGLRGDATFNGAVDDVVLFKQTATCAPQGVWDYYLEAENSSGVRGTTSGPHTVTIV